MAIRPPLPRRAYRDLVGRQCPAGQLIVATTDPARLPGHSCWYLPRPVARRTQQANLANLGDVVRLYGLPNWVEQGYKQVKGELGWADDP